MNINSLEKVSILILASGNGSNAENIIKFFQKQKININWIIITNNSKAGVIKRAQRLNVPYVVFEKKDFEREKVLEFITKMNPFIIILAGFLLKIPQRLINKFPDKIINIHPSLLPKYGGKGMYGMNVHKKVIENNESESGISIHYVNKNYDEGKIIFQKSIAIKYPCNPETLSQNIHELEIKYFPEVIKNLISS
ncbi:MAG: formyltransferase family protein [Flavobacteriaceae bacterium]